MPRFDVARGLEVVRAGPLTTVQDLGRDGWAHLGVPTSGAADRASLRLANRLVGNREGAAALEVTLGGLEVRAVGALTVAVTGAAGPILVDGAPSPARTVLPLRTGATLRLGLSTIGVRAYLAVRGGIDVPPVLGSRSSDTLSRLGPAALQDGETLALGSEVAGWPVLTIAPGPEPTAGIVRLGVIYGPRDDALSAEGRRLLLDTTWRASERSDRIGVRLEGPPLPVPATARTLSEPVVRGAIQVPPGGRPVLFLADHPVTGGYPVVAVVPDAEVDRAGQLRPGQGLRFEFRRGPVWDKV
jgi:biotin-dependent carboxylase-like uncharacterized protein